MNLPKPGTIIFYKTPDCSCNSAPGIYDKGNEKYYGREFRNRVIRVSSRPDRHYRPEKFWVEFDNPVISIDDPCTEYLGFYFCIHCIDPAYNLCR